MNKEKARALKWMIKNTAAEQGFKFKVSATTIIEYDEYEYHFGIPHVTTIAFSHAGDRYYCAIETQADGAYSIHSAKEVMVRLERLTCACTLI